jgi:hypothetical protein
MSEQNGTQKKSRAMGHVQFFQACECLKKHKQAFLDERPTASEAALKLTQILGFTVSTSSVGHIKQATGINWQPRVKAPGRSERKLYTSRALRTLTVAVHRLYRKLGEEAPHSLMQLYNELAREAPVGEETDTQEQPK